MSLHQISESERQRSSITRARLERLGVKRIVVPKPSTALSPVIGENPSTIAKSEPLAVLLVNDEQPAPFNFTKCFEHLLRSMEPPPRLAALAVNVRRIVTVVAKFYGLAPRHLLSEKRTSDLVMPRHIAMWLSRNITGYSFPEIGMCMNGKHHTTVLHAVRKIEFLRIKKPEIQSQIDQLLFALHPVSPEEPSNAQDNRADRS